VSFSLTGGFFGVFFITLPSQRQSFEAGIVDEYHLDELLDFARRTARMAGNLLLKKVSRRHRVERKGVIDLVTEVDRLSERAIVEAIRSAFPEHSVLAEEGSGRAEAGGLRWIVDPLDGTTNYAHGYPCYSISLALERGGRIDLGVVYDPLRDEMFEARRGSGALLNGKPLSVSTTDLLTDSLLATGFPYDIRTSPDNNLDHFTRFALRAQGIRRDGSAALDLCYLAAGRFDGFWEMKLSPWDVAAGTLMVIEAGGQLSDFAGGPFRIDGRRLVGSNGRIHDQMIAVLQKTESSTEGGTADDR
jgi:myo-inositol-1(or 4)-monophosphatase